jgi:leucyl aminopeptidase
MHMRGGPPGPADLQLLFQSPGPESIASGLGPELDAALARQGRKVKPGQLTVLRWADRDYSLAPLPADAQTARTIGVGLARLAGELGARRVAVSELPPALADELALGVRLGAYRFTTYKADERPGLEEVAVGGLKAGAVSRVQAVADGVTLARDLVNLPFNDLDAEALAAVARDLADTHGLELEVWDRAECERRGLGLFLAVAAASAHEPRFIQLRYRPASPMRSVALVGKGVMFDTGGYSVKTAQGMATMKGDMGGAAAVLGAMKAVARLAPGVEVRAYVAACDNAISGPGMRPGDIYRGLTGKTVEVTNTDAEGRLTLADALAVAEGDAPDAIVDLATLTGAKVTALGDDIAALFSNDDSLAGQLQEAAARAGERVWRLPLPDHYLKGYRKGVADLKNSDMKPSGGSIKAALFLREFVTRPWAHLDIAGNALREEEHELGPAGGTGYGVMTLVELIAPRTQGS